MANLPGFENLTPFPGTGNTYTATDPNPSFASTMSNTPAPIGETSKFLDHLNTLESKTLAKLEKIYRQFVPREIQDEGEVDLSQQEVSIQDRFQHLLQTRGLLDRVLKRQNVSNVNDYLESLPYDLDYSEKIIQTTKILVESKMELIKMMKELSSKRNELENGLKKKLGALQLISQLENEEQLDQMFQIMHIESELKEYCNCLKQLNLIQSLNVQGNPQIKIKCCICHTNSLIQALDSCGHLLCGECFENLPSKKCPQCRKSIFKSIKLYHSDQEHGTDPSTTLTGSDETQANLSNSTTSAPVSYHYDGGGEEPSYFGEDLF